MPQSNDHQHPAETLIDDLEDLRELLDDQIPVLSERADSPKDPLEEQLQAADQPITAAESSVSKPRQNEPERQNDTIEEDLIPLITERYALLDSEQQMQETDEHPLIDTTSVQVTAEVTEQSALLEPTHAVSHSEPVTPQPNESSNKPGASANPFLPTDKLKELAQERATIEKLFHEQYDANQDELLAPHLQRLERELRLQIPLLLQRLTDELIDEAMHEFSLKLENRLQKQLKQLVEQQLAELLRQQNRK